MSNEAKTYVIDGKTFVEVDRKANVGDFVIGLHTKRINEVIEVEGSGKVYGFGGWVAARQNYRVLEPVDQAPANTEDIIANLVRRVAALEQAQERLSALERGFESFRSQLRDTQNNVERQGVEIAEVTALAQSNEADIRDLDERTQPKNPSSESVTIPKWLFEGMVKHGGARG